MFCKNLFAELFVDASQSLARFYWLLSLFICTVIPSLLLLLSFMILISESIICFGKSFLDCIIEFWSGECCESDETSSYCKFYATTVGTEA